MTDLSFLDWPFFDDRHRDIADRLDAWASQSLTQVDHGDVDAACRDLVQRLGHDGLLNACVAPTPSDRLDVRTLCLTRETLARYDGLADFAFAMQGLGAGPISLFGSPEQRETWLPKVAAGQAIAAFALSEPEAGSDVAALATTAERDGNHFVLNGTKTWISNGGIADFYILFARTGEAPGARGLSAFVVPADAPDDKMWGVNSNYGFPAEPMSDGGTGTVQGRVVAKPGAYEARYVTGMQDQVLARAPLTVVE